MIGHINGAIVPNTVATSGLYLPMKGNDNIMSIGSPQQITI